MSEVTALSAHQVGGSNRCLVSDSHPITVVLNISQVNSNLLLEFYSFNMAVFLRQIDYCGFIHCREVTFQSSKQNSEIKNSEFNFSPKCCLIRLVCHHIIF